MKVFLSALMFAALMLFVGCSAPAEEVEVTVEEEAEVSEEVVAPIVEVTATEGATVEVTPVQ